MSKISLVAVFIVISLILPSVSALSIFGETDVYTTSYDKKLFEQVKPGIIGIKPEIIYWRVMEQQGEGEIKVVEMFLYWAQQEYYISNHPHDWEFLVLFVNKLNDTYMVSYDEWHYIIGRDFSVRLYDGSHIFISITEEYHPISIFDGVPFGGTVDDALNYSDIDVEKLDNDILRDAAKQVGFNEKLYNDPCSFVDRGWFGYKETTAWRSVWRAILVGMDKKFDWIDFEG